MLCKFQGGWSAPCALDLYIFQEVADQFADACASIDMRNDLEQEVGCQHASTNRFKVQCSVLVAHGGGGYAHRAIVQRAYQRVFLHNQCRCSQFFGEAPELASASDGCFVVEVHGMHIATSLSLKGHWNDLPGLGVVAKARGVGHAYELVFDDGFGHLQWLRNNSPQRLQIGPVGDDQKFPIDETVGAGRKGRIGQGYGKGGASYFIDVHRDTQVVLG